MVSDFPTVKWRVTARSSRAFRFVCSLDDRDGRLGVWAGGKVRHFVTAARALGVIARFRWDQHSQVSGGREHVPP